MWRGTCNFSIFVSDVNLQIHLLDVKNEEKNVEEMCCQACSVNSLSKSLPFIVDDVHYYVCLEYLKLVTLGESFDKFAIILTDTEQNV